MGDDEGGWYIEAIAYARFWYECICKMREREKSWIYGKNDREKSSFTGLWPKLQSLCPSKT